MHDTTTEMARTLRPLRNFDIHGVAALAATQAGFSKREVAMHLPAAIEHERARRDALGNQIVAIAATAHGMGAAHA